MRAPLAPPRLSEPRKVEAEAQAVATSSETDKPEARIFALSVRDVRRVDQRMVDRREPGPARSVPRPAPLGRDSATRGPMSRWVSLNQARAKASAN